METLFIVMPAYNEEENIEWVLHQWLPILDGKNSNSRLVVADAGSVDQTHEILLRMKKEFPQIEIISNTEKQHGPKLIALYNYAIQQGADYIFQTDSDGQTNPDEFEWFWENKSKYDVILGNRTKRGDGNSRAFVEKVVCLLLGMFFGVHVPDANAPFRLMKAEIVAKYLDRMPNTYNLPNIMLTVFFSYYRENIYFKIIEFKPRQGGKNSINLIKICKIGWHALRDFYFFRKKMEKL